VRSESIFSWPRLAAFRDFFPRREEVELDVLFDFALFDFALWVLLCEADVALEADFEAAEDLWVVVVFVLLDVLLLAVESDWAKIAEQHSTAAASTPANFQFSRIIRKTCPKPFYGLGENRAKVHEMELKSKSKYPRSWHLMIP
jgi:hypothetical protein